MLRLHIGFHYDYDGLQIDGETIFNTVLARFKIRAGADLAEKLETQNEVFTHSCKGIEYSLAMMIE